MSESELLLIGISMVLATGLVKCVEGLYHALRSQRRHWMPPVLLSTSFIYGVNFLWAYKDNLAENPPYLFYASSIALASTFFLRAHILATDSAAQIEDWGDHLHEVARSYFAVACMTSLLSLIALWSNNETTGFDAQSIPFWVGIGLHATGAISKKVSVWSAVGVGSLILQVVASYLLFTNDMI